MWGEKEERTSEKVCVYVWCRKVRMRVRVRERGEKKCEYEV
jgi:hypothetical protein